MITITTLNPEDAIRILSLNGWEFESTANEIYIPLGEGADEESVLDQLEDILDGIPFILR